VVDTHQAAGKEAFRIAAAALEEQHTAEEERGVAHTAVAVVDDAHTFVAPVVAGIRHVSVPAAACSCWAVGSCLAVGCSAVGCSAARILFKKRCKS
jgi:hypothetical protein